MKFCCKGAVVTNEHRFTFVERIAEPITVERSGGQIVNPCCAIIGQPTKLKVSVLPEDFPDAKIHWLVKKGSGSFDNSTGREVVFRANGSDGSHSVVQVDVGDPPRDDDSPGYCPGNAPQFTLRNTTMLPPLKIFPCVVSTKEKAPPIEQSQIESMLDEVNVIFRQVGVRVVLGANVVNVVNDDWSKDALLNYTIRTNMLTHMSHKDGLEVYFIQGRGNKIRSGKEQKEPLGLCCTDYDKAQVVREIVVRVPFTASTLAHEIGHALNWPDIYIEKGDNMLNADICRNNMKDDWNNGTGRRFYDLTLTQSDIVARLLMYGEHGETKGDIPLGSVKGLNCNGMPTDLAVGREGGIFISSPRSK